MRDPKTGRFVKATQSSTTQPTADYSTGHDRSNAPRNWHNPDDSESDANWLVVVFIIACFLLGCLGLIRLILTWWGY